MDVRVCEEAVRDRDEHDRVVHRGRDGRSAGVGSELGDEAELGGRDVRPATTKWHGHAGTQNREPLKQSEYDGHGTLAPVDGTYSEVEEKASGWDSDGVEAVEHKICGGAVADGVCWNI